MENDIASKPHMLIVEDNQLTRLLLYTIFSSMCFDVKEMDNGSDVLPYLDTKLVDIMILDLELPGMTGDQIFTSMKKHPQHAKIPVIPFTAHKAPETAGTYANNIIWAEYQKSGNIPNIIYKLDEKTDVKNITKELIYEVAALLSKSGKTPPQEMMSYIFETGGFEEKNDKTAPFPPHLRPPI